MSKCGYIRARVEPKLKEDVEGLLATIGLSPSQAITLFYTQIKLNKGIPFPIKISNEVTLEALKDSENTKGLTRYKSAKDMFKGLGV
ncbi:type II toxin-antitoxin system RelB/DinJ family antitoxin [Pelosinus sp. sgz500959]|uniref:type II toxin-antitoxin system RelB/DinJ family antitoxin n=1 Tax=Pelosinus sp. sgz500959 TaxID=3242472 RepID=UPI0036729AB7